MVSNSNKIFAYLIGSIFLIAGFGIVLEMFSISFSSILLLLVGIFTWCMYLKIHFTALKYISCFLVPTGLAYFLIAVFRLDGVANFILVYSSLICAFLCVYFLCKKKVFIYISLVIALFVLHTITYSDEVLRELIVGYDCLYIGLLFAILFVFEYKALRYIPLLITVVAYIIGLLNLLNAYNVITPTVYKTGISLVFLAVGGGIILINNIKTKNYNKENRCE